jgi:hypothetical protein
METLLFCCEDGTLPNSQGVAMAVIDPKPDRRSADRAADPHCDVCKADRAEVTLRTPLALYCQCNACGHIWVERCSVGDSAKAHGCGMIQS